MIFEDWGLINYQESFDKQLFLVDEISKGKGEERVVFCSHPPVVTLGRGSSPSDLIGWSGEVVEINRGGKATYHGPSQLVIYPLLDLNRTRSQFVSRDIGAYLRFLESWMIKAFKSFDLDSKAVTTSKEDSNSYTGVWIGDQKVASIGIAVKKWVTHHGAAINLAKDDLAFTGISPCGFKPNVMTSLEEKLQRKVSYQEMKEALISAFQS